MDPGDPWLDLVARAEGGTFCPVRGEEWGGGLRQWRTVTCGCLGRQRPSASDGSLLQPAAATDGLAVAGRGRLWLAVTDWGPGRGQMWSGLTEQVRTSPETVGTHSDRFRFGRFPTGPNSKIEFEFKK
jgi:hypothetical protein